MVAVFKNYLDCDGSTGVAGRYNLVVGGLCQCQCWGFYPLRGTDVLVGVNQSGVTDRSLRDIDGLANY